MSKAGEPLPSLEKRISDLLRLITVQRKRCSGCGAALFMVQHNTGKRAPYTEDGLNHFMNCPNRDQFRRQQQDDKPT